MFERASPEYILHPRFRDSVYVYRTDPEWSPVSFWKIKHDLEVDYPHVTLTMQHGLDAGEDERLLRGEVLTILAIMRTRLEVPLLKDHLVIPVSYHARF
jgi:hypothetical protein